MSNQQLVDTFVSNWLAALKNHDKAKLLSMLHSSITFYSPVKPTTDRAYIDQILRWIIDIVEDFTYVDTYTNPSTLGVVLLFKGKHKNIEIEGADFIKLNQEGKVIELKVMLRPLKATVAVGEEMKRRFRALTEFGTPLESDQHPQLPTLSKL